MRSIHFEKGGSAYFGKMPHVGFLTSPPLQRASLTPSGGVPLRLPLSSRFGGVHFASVGRRHTRPCADSPLRPAGVGTSYSRFSHGRLCVALEAQEARICIEQLMGPLRPRRFLDCIRSKTNSHGKWSWCDLCRMVGSKLRRLDASACTTGPDPRRAAISDANKNRSLTQVIVRA